MLQTLSVLLLFLSLALWLATNYTSSICEEKKLKEAILLSETVQEDNYVRKNTDNNTDTPHNFNEHVEGQLSLLIHQSIYLCILSNRYNQLAENPNAT